MHERIGEHVPPDPACLAASDEAPRSGQAAGDAAWISAATRRGRAVLALNAAGRARGRRLIVSGALGHFLAALPESEPPAITPISPDLDDAVAAARVSNLTSAEDVLIILGSDRLWQPRSRRALARLAPKLVVVDTGEQGFAVMHEWLAAGQVLARLRLLFPECPFVFVTGPGVAPPGILDRHLFTTRRFVGGAWPNQCTLLVLGQEQGHFDSTLPGTVLQGHSGRAMIIGPTRGAVDRMTAALRRAGHDAAPYHLGMLAVRRAAVARAYRDGRQLTLVTTEAILREEALPAPSLLVIAHLPTSLSSLLRLVSLVEAAPRAEVRLLRNADDPARPAATTVLPDLGTIRQVYSALRQTARRGVALVDHRAPLDRGGDRVPGERYLALDLLERAGYVRRDDDVPRAVAICNAGSQPREAWPGVLPPLQPGETLHARLGQLAARRGLTPDAVHEALLAREAAGELLVRGIGLQRQYTLLAPPSNGQARLAAALRGAAATAYDERRRIRDWVVAPGCRVRALAAALGFEEQPSCGRCDFCIGATRRREAPDESWLFALSALATVGLDMPRTAVYRVVERSLRLAGRSYSPALVARLVDRLLGLGALEPRAGELGEVLGVSDEGRRILATRAAGSGE